MSEIVAISPLFNDIDLDQAFVKQVNHWLAKEKIEARVQSFPYVDHNDPLRTILSYYQEPINTLMTEGYFGFTSKAQYGYADSKEILFLDVGSILGDNVVPQIAKAPLMASTHEIGRVLKKKVKPETKKIIFTNVSNLAPDLGLGFLEELGIEFFNSTGKKIKISSGKIGQIYSFSYEKMAKKWLGYEYLILENDDKKIPLVGEGGISFTHQQLTGASPEIAKLLDRETLKAVNTFEKILGKRILYLEEASVGNGFAFGCLSFFRNVTVKNQVDAFIELTNFGKDIEKSDYFIIPSYYESFRGLLNKSKKKTFLLQHEEDKIVYDNEMEIPTHKIDADSFEFLLRQIQSVLKIFYFRSKKHC
ncbi:glycerate kinase [Vagococcus sp.]|uniref:glycerate kinase n=1 Tax=Vagococcus sp. TaxID=1933889 RepID=UPI002FCB298E